MSVITHDHTEEFRENLAEALNVALEEIGITAEGHAKMKCAVDTGLLRNSITHALDGGFAAVSGYQDNGGTKHGSYSGSVPKERGGNRSVYIGTNVEYAPYVEMGTSHTREQPFLKPAAADHADEYRRILESRLKG